MLDKEMLPSAAVRPKKSKSSGNRQIDYMWEEYETHSDSSALHTGRRNLTDPADDEKRCTSILKNEIRKLGTVNVNAIEDYKESS